MRNPVAWLSCRWKAIAVVVAPSVAFLGALGFTPATFLSVAAARVLGGAIVGFASGWVLRVLLEAGTDDAVEGWLAAQTPEEIRALLRKNRDQEAEIASLKAELKPPAAAPSYVEDVFGGIRWRWSWYVYPNGHLKVEGLHAFCPREGCDHELHGRRVPRSGSTGRSATLFLCPLCGAAAFEDGDPGDVVESATLLIERNLRVGSRGRPSGP